MNVGVGFLHDEWMIEDKYGYYDRIDISYGVGEVGIIYNWKRLSVGLNLPVKIGGSNILVESDFTPNFSVGVNF